ncbi:ribosomal protein L1 [Macrolepiota fuliginosa MF-IS2]|uniref:Ribosomal protein L1 n=1 Tax=Macrolepiota fuliginosa MF-IS2 TaxID=1400762 RepID=A0A9P6C7Q0_9AGAR|nr:ribosomal protein L1 [Macrolepiota fuliginosa MF-IS2]
MLGLLLRCRQCQIPARDAFLQIRAFSTTQSSLGKHDKKSTIRIPSKKAAAAKARRKAAVIAAEDAKAEKLTLSDAISVLRAVEVASPNNTYELYIKTEIKSGVAVPKGRVNLPREAKPKSEDKILVFAEGRQAEEAKKAGAHIVGGTELIDGIVNGRVQATTILCTPALIKAITPKLGRVLGPLGLMPSERRGTVTDDIAGYLQRIQGTSEWRADRAGNIRTPIALLHFPTKDVIQNIRHFLASVKKVTGNTRDGADSRRVKSSGPRPVTTISKVMLSSTQGPGIRISDF